MDRLTHEGLDALCAHRGERCLTFYIPTPLAWPDCAQHSTRCDNLLRQARFLLGMEGLNDKAIEEFLRPVVGLANQQEIQDNCSASVAIFHSQSLTAAYSLPHKTHERVLLANRFYVLPLVHSLMENGRYYILALSKQETRLLECEGDHLREVTHGNLPRELESTLRLDPRDPSLQAHGGVRFGKAGRSTVVHGQGGPGDWAKDELKGYFRKVEHAVSLALQGSTAPLILACVDYYGAIYREVNHYPGLQRDTISGSPDTLSDRELLSRGRKIAGLEFDRAQDAALRQCYELSDTRLYSSDLRKILVAAQVGQVDTLYLADESVCWGSFDAAAGVAKVFDEQEPGSEDLLNLTAVETLAHGGRVVLAPTTDLPYQCTIAAIFRYEPADIDYVARLDRPRAKSESP